MILSRGRNDRPEEPFSVPTKRLLKHRQSQSRARPPRKNPVAVSNARANSLVAHAGVRPCGRLNRQMEGGQSHKQFTRLAYRVWLNVGVPVICRTRVGKALAWQAQILRQRRPIRRGSARRWRRWERVTQRRQCPGLRPGVTYSNCPSRRQRKSSHAARGRGPG
jgi:hypothetical protein